MRIVVQRAKQASVVVEGKIVAAIDKGLVLLVGITHADTEQDASYLAEKIAHLRIFEDENKKMNRSIKEAGGAILSVSQFTLYGDCRKGRRPGFDAAARPALAKPLYEFFNAQLRAHGLTVAEGVFGAHMEVSLVNDGPVTLIIESK
jgi:D-tyrosyl-tRNA(Tyr) deacylase